MQAGRTKATALAVDDARASVRRKRIENRAGQHVAAIGPTVAKHAVEEQVVGDPLTNADERRLAGRALRDRLTGLGEEDVRGEVRERDVRPNVAGLVEQRLAQCAKPKAAFRWRGGGLSSPRPPPPIAARRHLAGRESIAER